MPLSPGDKIGPYDVLSLLGQGGMGEVYRAHDAKLNRDVAIKVLPTALANDAKYMARFAREAQMLAAQNHPNIATVYGIEQGALVMELVEGSDLMGPLPLEEAIAIARQIAAGLEAAHEKGIIHRDLKPANIKLTPDGLVKILDFGLAKSTEANSAVVPGSNPTIAPTLSMHMTQTGMILGTAAYMSPEQARGKAVDRRTDIWAFGVVMYEVVTGKRLFEGEDLTEILASVVKDKPDLSGVPVLVRRLLERCLEKDPKKRLRDIGDWELLLGEGEVTAPRVEPPAKASATWVSWGVAGVMTLGLAGLAVVHFRERPSEERVTRTSILPPDKTTFNFGSGSSLPAISPDGRRLVFGADSADGKTQLWVRPLDALSAQPLLGTEGASMPFWSPDGRYVAFKANRKLKKIDISGGPPITLADAFGLGGTWSPEGVIIFAPLNADDPLQRISAAGGTSTSATTIDEKRGIRHRFPWFLPDGHHFLYVSETRLSEGSRLLIHVAALDSKDDKVVSQADSNAIYSQGHLLFLREDTLMAQPFDPVRLAVTGEAAPVAERVPHILNPGSVGFFTASGNGLLVFRSMAEDSTTLMWFDRSGKRGAVLGDAAGELSLSPDGNRLAATRGDSSNRKSDIWIYDIARGIPTRFTFEPASNPSNPVWSPDGGAIVFSKTNKRRRDLYRKPSNLAGAEEPLYAEDDYDKYPESWSKDGKFLLYGMVGSKGFGLGVLPLTPGPEGKLKPFPFLPGARGGQFSPDGKWVAYQSAESGQPEIYVAPFPGPGGKRQISTGGGYVPRWRADGKEIFFGRKDRKLVAVEVSAKGGALEVGTVRALFGPLVFGPLAGGSRTWDVTPDGQRILALAAPEQEAVAPFTLIQNWTAGLKK